MTSLRLAYSGPGIPAALRPVRSHVALRPTNSRPYDHERDEAPLDLALSVLVANAKRSEIDAVHQAAAVVEAAHREGFLVALTPTQRVVDTRHPSCADDTDPTPPRGTKRGA